MRTALLLAFVVLLIGRSPAQAQDAATWPHTMTSPNGATVEVYQPQAISWPDEKTLTARMALAITPPGAKTPFVGTLELAFATTIDNATHLITLADPKLISTHFPSLDTERAQQVNDRIAAVLPTLQLKQVPLDAVVLSLKELPQTVKPVAVNNDPPAIFHADRPASLVVFDGDPVLARAGNSGLKYAVNTNWDVFFDPAGKGTWFLLNNGIWLAAPAATGAYALASRLPAAFAKLPSDANFADARKAMPAKSVPPSQVPSIFVSTKPAEIIVTEGAPQFAAVPGTGLQYVKNTASDLFFDKAQGRFYYLTSGRWFAASGLDGPWSFASNDLPPDFALIPPDGERGEALASVPGTSQAQLAVLRAQIPQQATLKRADAKLTVSYAGAPEFRPLPGIDLAYAVNTAFEVLETDGKYYVCYQGAWFVGATPNGPWALADSVPPAVRSIPPSSPVYNVSYVNVYGSTAETVTYGYTAGYTMGYVAAGVLVYGTGYYYPPYVGPGVVPVFLPYPYSYAGSVWYNPAVGAWARGGTCVRPVRWRGHRREGVQSGDRSMGPRRGGVRTLWRCGCLVGLQSRHRYLRTRQRRLGTERPHRQCQFLQSALRRLGQHDAECQCLFALGLQHGQRTQPHRQHGERQQRARLGRSDQLQHRRRGRRRPHSDRQQRRDRSHRQRQRVCRRRRQRLQAHRHRLVEVGQRLAVDEIAD